jgi:hypothetical protein
VLPTSLFHCLFVLQCFTRALLHLSDQLPLVFITVYPQLLQQHDAVPSQHVSHHSVCIREAEWLEPVGPGLRHLMQELHHLLALLEAGLRLCEFLSLYNRE